MNQFTEKENRSNRKSKTAEWFTPISWIRSYLENKNLKKDPTDSTIFIDPTGGNGNWLIDLHNAGYITFSIDIVPANCIETILRLYGEGEIDVCHIDKVPILYKNQKGFKELYTHNKKIILNVICADTTEFSLQPIYNFFEKKIEIFGNNLFVME
jgi:hypothetical protein